LIDPIPFDPSQFIQRMGYSHHGGLIGIGYVAHGQDWAELELPWRADLVGDPEQQILASGPVVTLMDMATSLAVWMKRGGFVPHATLDLRVDYLRPAEPRRTVIGRGECYRLSRAIAFVRGIAHDGDPGDPVAHVAGTFMTTGGAA
jgi:uncharacterized protein (TIGR00369 family)